MRETTMKNTLSAVVALPTAVAIALGGFLMITPAASAAPAAVVTPVETGPDATVPDQTVPDQTVPVETVPVETVPDQTVPVETVPGEAVPVETVPGEAAPGETAPVEDDPSGGATPSPSAEPAPSARPSAAAIAAPGFTVESPVDGQLLESAGVRVEASVPAGSTVELSSPSAGGVRVVVADGVFSSAFELPAAATAARHTISLQVTGPDGADLGTVDRDVVVAGLPTSAAPTISAPVDGGTVVGVYYTASDFETGAILLEGTGTPGASIDIDLAAIDPVVAWGYDDREPVVSADGTWSRSVYMPYGLWRVSVGQSAIDADGFTTVLPSETASVVVRVVRPAGEVAVPADAAPVVTTPTPGSTVVGRPDAGRGMGGSQIFTISGTGTPGTAVGIYGFFTEGRAPIDAYAAAARGELPGAADFEPLVAGDDPVLVAADGTWTTTQSIRPGTYSFAAFTISVDPSAPTMSGPSDVVTFTLAAPATAVGAVDIVSPADTAGLAYTGAEGSGPLSIAALVVIGLGLVAVGYARRRGRRLS